MRKSLAVILCAIILALGVSSVSVTLQAQQRAQDASNDAFVALRNALGSNSIGKVEIDLRNRAFKLSDLELHTEQTPGVSLKIRELAAVGIDLPSERFLSAKRIDALDVEFSWSIDQQPSSNIVYKAPRITINDFSGPIRAPHPIDASSTIEVMRLVFEQFIASAATSAEIPILTANIPSSSTPSRQPIGPTNVNYSDLRMHDIRNGRIAEMSTGHTQFTVATPPELFGTIKGEIGRAITADFDAGVLLVVLDGKSNDDRPLRLHSRAMAGPYTVRSENGGLIQIDAIELDNTSLRPAKIRFADLLALMQAPRQRGSAPGPAEMAALVNLIADFHEGIGMDLFEVRGVTFNPPQGPTFRLGAFHLKGLEAGKLAEIALEGVEGQTPQQQPIRIGRIALKGLDIANMDRLAAKLGAGTPPPEQIVQLLPLVEGAEIRDVIGPSKDSGGVIHIDNFAISWGQFVGSIPTAAHVTGRMSAPLDIDNPDVRGLLAGVGITNATVGFDLGAAWTQRTGVFALTPMHVEIDKLFSLDARLSIESVPEQLFTANPDQADLAAGEIKAGLLEFELHDAGALDLAVAQFAAQNGVSPQTARMALIDALNQAAAPFIAADPQFRPVVASIARFIETSRGSLTIRLIPKGQVPLKMTIEAMGSDPFGALSQFRIETTTMP